MKYTYESGARPIQGYTIQRGIGRGGFGEVYLAISDGGKEVALKLVQRNLNVELRGVGHCLNLKHTNLVVVYDIVKAENDDNWIVMEYVAGPSLDQVLARHPQGMPEREVLAWLVGICAGVGYLHEHGIVHRDLKPGNLFVEQGVVKLGDYGLSKFISASQRSGQTESVGTVHYMAPEISLGRYGKEVDQYALGIILHEMLTGRLPFDGETSGEILMKHLVAEPDLAALPEPYRSVVARLLNKDPQGRYAALSDILDELPALGAARPSAILGSAAVPDPREPIDSDTQPYVERPSRPRDAGFDPARLIELLEENGIDDDEIGKVLDAVREYPEQDSYSMFKVVRTLVENGMADGEDIAEVIHAFGHLTQQDANGMITAIQVLIENGTDDSEEIAGVLHALGKYPQHDSNELVSAVRTMSENSFEAEDIARVLHALGKYSGRNLPGMMKAMQSMIENSVEAEDVACLLRVLGEYPKQDLPHMAKGLQTMIEQSMDADDVVRVLRSLGECPVPSLPAVVRAAQSMVEQGMEAEDIARLVRALGSYPEQDLPRMVGTVQSMVDDGIEADEIAHRIRTLESQRG